MVGGEGGGGGGGSLTGRWRSPAVLGRFSQFSLGGLAGLLGFAAHSFRSHTSHIGGYARGRSQQSVWCSIVLRVDPAGSWCRCTSAHPRATVVNGDAVDEEHGGKRRQHV